MPGSSGQRLTLGIVLGLACLCFLASAERPRASDVPGAVKSADGTYTFEHEDIIWQVIDHPESDKLFYFNPATQMAQWEDPRIVPLDDVVVTAPRVELKKSSAPVAVTAIVPVVAFILAIFGRIAYLQTYYPDLLWPSKERKNRRKNNQKFKPQKARGKMSQDGKGGRSANS